MVNAAFLKMKIRRYDNVFIMAHKDLDFDAFGSMLGIYYFVSSIKGFKDKVHLIVEERKHGVGVNKIFEQAKGFDNIRIVSYRKVKSLVNDKSLLIITDTSKKELVQSEEIYEDIKDKIMIDHHFDKEMEKDKDTEYLGNNDVSSASEIVTAYIKNLNVPSFVTTAMLCGIKIDTNDFNVKTTLHTYKAAATLIKIGADNKEASILLKESFKNYFDQYDLITNTEIVGGKIAISYGYPQQIYKKEELAKVSDALFKFEDIEMSFTIGRIQRDVIGISARSLGNTSVQDIMEDLGGGGDNTAAATRMEGYTIYEAKEELLSSLKKRGLTK